MYRRHRHDQLSMVPAQLAPAFFGFGAYDFAHSRYSSLGDCRGFDGAENRLTQWLLHQKLRVCVIGHNSSGFDVRYYLHKIPSPVGSPLGSSASPNAVVSNASHIPEASNAVSAPPAP